MASKRSFTLENLNAAVAKLAPPDWAEPWDNVGLQAGDPAAPVRRALICLELTRAVLEEARRKKVQAIVAHHPLIFKPLKSAAAEGRVGGLLHALIANGIGFIAAHTNLDKSDAGPNFAVAEAIGLQVEGFLETQSAADSVKIVVFTPEGYERALIDAASAAGGGGVGNYSHCSFRTPGVGTFIPHAGADPFIGEVGKFEEARESRLEILVPNAAVDAVVRSVLAAHPYEEPAYDVYPLAPGAARAGLGLIGVLRKPEPLGALRKRLHRELRDRLPGGARARFKAIEQVGDDDKRPIARVAILTGSGGSLVPAVARHGADCYITGELSYHDAVEARALGLAILAPGHFVSEAAAMPFFARRLGAETGIELLVSEEESDPLRVDTQ